MAEEILPPDPPLEYWRIIGPPATATWKISQETFRRLARTGEFAQPEPEPKKS